MKIRFKSGKDLQFEPSHDGNGKRKPLIDKDVSNMQWVAHNIMFAGKTYEWQNHDGVDEIMYCLKGSGVVRDADGKYPFTAGDVLIFPNGVFHEITNTGETECENIFIRVFTK